LNTILLLTSGASITYSHNAIIAGNKFIATIALLITIFFAVIFTWLQLLEYQTAPFSISDGAYGSVFYLTTGFHGFHVIVGTIFLVVCAFRLGFFNHFSLEHHFGFEAAA
jgi:heme/copper-type cytochrome/quinol oxidase subunit 3